MSELKETQKTSLQMFVEEIKGNQEHFKDKEFYNFLLNRASKFMTYEKKQIQKSFKNGFKTCLRFNEIPFNGQMETLKALDVAHLYYEDKYGALNLNLHTEPNLKQEVEVLEKEVSPKEETKLPTKEEEKTSVIETLILKELEDSGVNTDNVKVKFIKL